ncbi:hypothetical protein [Cryobacterium fucosi]|uniref:Uncharacterized protein n=1 Tax=Cryobacterium fucosi TaxID=1259157 RepID=A0A4R9B558_9MICO|nr:hypothetical protein [Cryobacterium fucosi]TFD74777.1 hypothetical protein E3T48_12720 [Cryobacterium fucosi]
MTETPTPTRELSLRDMLDSLAPTEPGLARRPRAHASAYPAASPLYDEVESRLDTIAEHESLALVATALVEHQARMARLRRIPRDARSTPAPSTQAVPAHRTAIDLWVMVFGDEDCTEYTGEALHRRTLVDAVPRAGERFSPGQLSRFDTLRPVVDRVEHAPFPENCDTPTVLVVVHVASVAEPAEHRLERQRELRKEGWDIALPQTQVAAPGA